MNKLGWNELISLFNDLISLFNDLILKLDQLFKVYELSINWLMILSNIIINGG